MGDKEAFLRMMIALALSILILIVFERLFFKPTPPPPPKKTEEPSQPLSLPKGKEEFGSKFGEAVIETTLYRMVLSEYGGRLKSLTLKRYNDKVELHPLSQAVQGFIAKIMGKKLDLSPPKPVELVTTQKPDELPLGLFLEGGLPYKEEIPWRFSKTFLEVKERPEELQMTWEGEGLLIERTLRFYPDKYVIETEIKLNREAPLYLSWIGRTDLKGSYYGFFGPILIGPEGRIKIKPKKISSEPLTFQGLDLFAFDQDYFASIIQVKEKGELILGRLNESLIYGLFGGEKGQTHSFRIYLGPKDEKELEKLSSSAKKVIDYGTFGLIAIPILKFMHLTHRLTGNWGLDIILLALLIKLIFLWPTQKSYEAMKEMQKIAPELKMLQKKYGHDKERLQREIMELYRRRRINPLSGCLPLLLQLPVFFALYRALLVSINLRHAPFVLWIRDLSSKDPTYISPILMGLSMILQQKLTPQQGDPAQQKMMLFMPILFTLLFLNFPSGLVLYWLSSNVFGIIHQLYVLRRGKDVDH
jgi:YidC/Oxa1 family membrane protein insertase